MPETVESVEKVSYSMHQQWIGSLDCGVELRGSFVVLVENRVHRRFACVIAAD